MIMGTLLFLRKSGYYYYYLILLLLLLYIIIIIIIYYNYYDILNMIVQGRDSIIVKKGSTTRIRLDPLRQMTS